MKSDRLPILALAALLLLTLPAAAQVPDTLLHSIPAPPVGLQEGAELGWSVAVEGAYTVIGAPKDGIGVVGAGVVKVFDSTTGALLFVIPNPGPPSADYFGYSVAISGTRVVVGARLADTGAINAGSAYVFDLGSGTPTVPVATLNNPSPATNDGFGYSVAISGTRVVIGTNQDDTNATDAGSAYVYELSSGTPTVPVATLNNPDPAAGDNFGLSVAISGTRVVVGAPNDDIGASDAGSAYLYNLGSITPTVPVAVLNNPSPAASDYFGNSVAISEMRVVVGARRDDTGAVDAGSAYVYDLGSGTPTVPVATLNNPGPAAQDYFGYSVSISGTRVVVGAYGDDEGASGAGSAYVYDLGGGTPAVPVATLNNPSPAQGDRFGFSVAVNGTLLVVGAFYDDTGALNAGSAYVYDLGSGTPTVPMATLNNPGPAAQDYFGYSVSISGTRVVVGAYGDDTGAKYAGSAYVYDVSSGTPAEAVATLNNPSPESLDYFGWSVAISGTHVVVGAHGDDTGAYRGGSAYVYDLGSSAPSVPLLTLNKPSPAAYDWFGYSVAISGTRVVVGVPYDDTGATDAGSAYVYELDSGTPTVPVATLNNPSPSYTDWFGYSVAISGTRVVIGANQDDAGASDAGIAYVYDLSSGTPTVPVATLNNPSPAVGDYFGNSVAISGTRVVVGAYNDDTGTTDAGSAYVYELDSGTPTVPVATLNNPSPATNDWFGYSVAISGTRVVVGANQDDTGAGNAGSAYVFDLDSGTQTVPVATLNNPTPGPAVGDLFGNSVAIDGTSVAIGTPNDDTVVPDKGFAYVFGPESTPPTGGLMTLAPASPFDPVTPLTVSFTDWSDASMPLSYSVYIDDLIIGVQSPTATRSLTAPTAPGTHTLKGRIYDALDNMTEVTQTFTVNTPQESFDAAMTAAGLTGPAAATTATPKNDGVENLLKHAFNMTLTAPDVRVLTPDTGTAGLPSITRPSSGIFRVEYLRRKNSGLIYTAQKSTDLANPSAWEPLTDTPSITSIDASWERVIYEEPYDANTTPRCFGRVLVTLP